MRPETLPGEKEVLRLNNSFRQLGNPAIRGVHLHVHNAVEVKEISTDLAELAAGAPSHYHEVVQLRNHVLRRRARKSSTAGPYRRGRQR